MKKIYITGLAGMLGSNIAFLYKDKYQVAGVDLVKTAMPGVDSDAYDILDEALVREKLSIARPDVVIHTVAAVNVDLCEMNPELAKRLNTETTKILAKICEELSIKLIYISTDAVFGPKENHLSTEEDETRPQNEYARTKLAGEAYVLANQNNLVLRTNIYGYNVQDKKSFGEWIVESLEKDETLTMFEDIYFSPILVNDLAEVIALCIENEVCGLYHACSTGAVNKFDFGRMIKEEFDLASGTIVRSNSDEFDFKADRSKYMGMSNDKLSTLLGHHMRTPKESIAYFKELQDMDYPKKLKEFGGI